ncbi:MAG: ERV1/ALR-related protein [Nitrososphaerales archaeon]
MIDSAKVGNSFWTILHTSATAMHDPPTQAERESFLALLESMKILYPCEECKPGFSYADRSIPSFISRAAVEEWACNFHNETNAHIGHPKFECPTVHQLYETHCPSCSRVTMLRTSYDLTGDIYEAEKNHLPLTDERAQRAANGLLDLLCMKYQVPKPKIRFEENTQFCPGTSCTIMDQKHPVESTQIWYNPRMFSSRTIGHEFYHYFSTLKKPEEIKALLGVQFKGDPDDEREADAFAFREMEDLFSAPNAKVLRDSDSRENGMTETITELKVMKQQFAMTAGRFPSVFDDIAMLYRPFAPYANLSDADLNEIYTPNILGSAFDVAYETMLTPLGSFFANIISWAVLAAIGASSDLAYYDRVFLQNWAANHGARILNLAKPNYVTSLSGSARSLGAAVSAGKAEGVARQLAKTPQEITGGFRAAFNAVQEAFGGLHGGATGGSSNTGNQYGGDTGVTPFQ